MSLPDPETRTQHEDQLEASSSDGAHITTPLARETRVDSGALTDKVEKTPSQGDSKPPLFDRYEILGPPVAGGMGLVFQARDPSLDRIVALKTIRSGALANPSEVERFQREARAVAKLRHDNIVTVFDFGQFQGQHYFTMDFVSGGALSQKIAYYASASPEEAVRLVITIARAVHYAHEQQILHRDLKPANIFIDGTGSPRVGDFGLAKSLNAVTVSEQPGTILGTYPYMSPEQMAGLNEEISTATDVWALGVILYELLTGKRPFDAPEKKKLSDLIREAKPASPCSLRPRLGTSLEAIILKCLAKEPTNRHPSALALVNCLQAWLDRKKRRIRWLAAAVLSLVLIVPLLLLFLNRDRELPDEPLPDQTEAVHGIGDELAARRPVVVIGESGGPKAFRLVRPQADVKLTRKKGRIFEFECRADISFLELIPALPICPLRLTADIQCAEGQGKAGIYFAHESQPTLKGEAHLFVLFGFGAGDNRVAPQSVLLGDPGAIGPFGLAQSKQLEFAAQLPGEARWRVLSVELFPDRFQASWDRQIIDAASTWRGLNDESNKRLTQRIALAKRIGDDLGFLGAVRVNHQPSQALGLFVQHATARFKNVILEAVANP
ncbi:MAG: serine/threonine protein kinase [Planctomycetes bacterium]|nr:serine/threonine protein kinase [Planctomycetota bacterium]